MAEERENKAEREVPRASQSWRTQENKTHRMREVNCPEVKHRWRDTGQMKLERLVGQA